MYESLMRANEAEGGLDGGLIMAVTRIGSFTQIL